MLEPSLITELYTLGHFTIREIARLDGRSHTMIHRILKKEGVEASAGEKVETACAFCGKRIVISRSKAKAQDNAYCGQEHYWAGKEKAGKLQPWKVGNTRLMRSLIVAQGFKLLREHWVAPLNGKVEDLDPQNLGVWGNEKEWKEWISKRMPYPIWPRVD